MVLGIHQTISRYTGNIGTMPRVSERNFVPGAEKPSIALARRNAESRSGERKNTQAKLTARKVTMTDSACRIQPPAQVERFSLVRLPAATPDEGAPQVIHRQVAAVQCTPDNKGPACAMPQPAERHGDH